MINIIAIFLHNLRNEGHLEFMTLFRNLVNEFAAVKAIVAALMIEFSILLDVEENVVDAQRYSEYTAEIIAADKRNDSLIKGIKKIVSGSIKHYNPEISHAAQHISDRLKTFKKIEAKAYEEEAAAIRILITDMQGTFAADAATVGITGWIEELAVALANFERLLKLRNDETASKQPHETAAEIRHKVDKVYQLMITRINAAAILDETDTFTVFINQLNAEINYFNTHTHVAAKKDIKTANIDPIPVQQATGKEVMPIPTAYYEDTELVFSKDYTVTYRNNINPGTATVILHGKGKYRGQRIATFNIIENQ
ncbi:MAG: DUF6261 family protein [Prevotellaceae bacterium]|jgi:hypothetical protein|nr:DUF6261 family protein [Prevotellaceae bacterium]